MIRCIRVDHTDFFQVDIKTHSFVKILVNQKTRKILIKKRQEPGKKLLDFLEHEVNKQRDRLGNCCDVGKTDKVCEREGGRG